MVMVSCRLSNTTIFKYSHAQPYTQLTLHTEFSPLLFSIVICCLTSCRSTTLSEIAELYQSARKKATAGVFTNKNSSFIWLTKFQSFASAEEEYGCCKVKLA